jgi:TPR repeat protein
MKIFLIIVCLLLILFGSISYFRHSEFKTILQAAKNGDANAQYELGHMYSEGYRVSQDSEKAFFWINKAAEQGDINAQYIL